MEDLALSFGGVFRGRRVLVTGDTGFKGSWLAIWLREAGAEVHGLALPPPPGPSHFEACRLRDRVRHADGDIRDLDVVRRAFDAAKPEIVFHLAAQALVRESYADPKGTFDSNVGGTVNVFEGIRACPSVRAAVIVTSDKCYENLESGQAYREEDRLGGRDPYAASKACAELVVHAYRKSFFAGTGSDRIGVASARAGNVVGGGDWAKDRLVPDCVRALAANRPVLVRNPASVRPWQHVLEPLAGYLRLAQKLLHDPVRFSAAFNFGPVVDSDLPALQVARMFLDAWGGGSIEIGDPDRKGPHEARLLQLSSERAVATLGFRPVLSAHDAVAWSATWYRRWRDAGDGADLLDVTTGQIRDYAARARSAGAPWTEGP